MRVEMEEGEMRDVAAGQVEREAQALLDPVRQAVQHAENVIESTLGVVTCSGAARWCAYLVPHGSGGWQVALASGSEAPEIGAVWAHAELPGAVARPIYLPREGSAHGGVLCAAPNRDALGDAHDGFVDSLHALVDHLSALVAHHAAHVAHVVEQASGEVATNPTPSPDLAGENETAAVPPGSVVGVARVIEDAVTGLLLHDVVLERLDGEIARAKRYGGGLSVLLCDLDGLGDVAAAAGEQARDSILAAVGATLRAHLRQIDCAGRYDQHTLLLLLPETGAEESMRAATRLAQFVAEAVGSVEIGMEAPPAVVLRVGASTYPAPGRSAQELLAQAADAVRAVRESGGDGWLAHAADQLNVPPVGGFRCVCRRCGKVFQVMDRAQQRARRFCSHECYTIARREGGAERDDLIRQFRAEGQSLRAIARRFGLSAERVRQILEAPELPAPEGETPEPQPAEPDAVLV